MKRLLTFIYGLLLFAFSIAFYTRFETTTEWYRWLYILGLLFFADKGFNKLDEATE